MSRIGAKPVPVPGNVTITVDSGDVTVKGPKGELQSRIAPGLSVKQEDGTLSIERPDNDRFNRSQHGLARTLINNMVEGVTNGHSKSAIHHEAAIALFVCWYNFCRKNTALGKNTSPAMAAGLTDHVWGLAELYCVEQWED